MKRNIPPRAPSPTPTTFSGISNYRTEPYRPIGSTTSTTMPTTIPPPDPRATAKVHYDELHRYLASYLARVPMNSRASARQKLTKLTVQQFQELSTDVYDELIRRNENSVGNKVPFLPVRDDFHPKRNQARQKLATLPTSRFEDLSSDVYFELARRYPEFKEQPQSSASAYDDYPSPDFPNSPPQRSIVSQFNSRTRRPSEDAGYGGTMGSGRRSTDRRRPPDEEYPPPRASQDNNYADYSPAMSSRRKPSQDIPRRSEERDRELARRPSVANSDSTATNAQTATATSGVVIPTKSTIAEEEIEIPFGKEVRESSGPTPERDRIADADAVTDESAEFTSPLGGLSGLTARLRAEEEDEGMLSTGNRSGDDYFDKMSFGRTASAASDRSGGGRISGGRTSVTNDDQEKLRKDYEFKIATMQSRITSLERDLYDADERAKERTQSEDRVRQLEGELMTVRRRMEEQTGSMRNLQHELEELKETRMREQESETRRTRQHEDDLQNLRNRCRQLEDEQMDKQMPDPEVVDQLRADMQGLLAELSDLSARNEELTAAKDMDFNTICELEKQFKEYKRKYEQARAELRSVKATSQLFLQSPRIDDQLISSDGVLSDVHFTAFLSAIDGLLAAGRSNAPATVLRVMKPVVDAVTAILSEAEAFEQRPFSDRPEVDAEALQRLRDQVKDTLGNLVNVAGVHARSSGLSPVSLLDAAASHLSLAVTDLGTNLRIRKTTRTEQNRPPALLPLTSNPFSSTSRSGEDTLVSRKTSGSSSKRLNKGSVDDTPQFASPAMSEWNFKTPLDTPPNLPPVASGDDSATQADNPEDAWTELKPYLEAQTEAIVYAIQSVLSGVRSPTPSPTLNENLTQIITIVSSIVAVCNGNVPPASAEQGKEILRELSDHANKLSEVQALSEVTKESRQIMAKSSFAVANAMKGLMKL